MSDAKAWEQMTPRQRDCWIAEHVMGWTMNMVNVPPGNMPPNIGDWMKGDRWMTDDEWSPSTDPAADYAVLEHIRENWPSFGRMACKKNVGRYIKEMWIKRGQEAGESDFRQQLTYYQPGDYSRAAYLAMQEGDHD